MRGRALAGGLKRQAGRDQALAAIAGMVAADAPDSAAPLRQPPAPDVFACRERVAQVGVVAGTAGMSAQALIDEAIACATQGCMADAAERFEQALALEPRNAAARTRLALIQRDEGDLQSAIANFEQALIDAPLADADAGRINLALTLDEAGQTARALELIGQSAGLLRASPAARWIAAHPVLRSGDYARGFALLESRWHMHDPRYRPRDYPQPRWNGETAAGKTLLLWHELGFGDTLQFIRFARQAAARGLKIVADVQPPLRALVADMPEVTAVAADSAALPDFDFHLPVMSLPHVLGLTLAQIDASPYIAVSARRREKWQALLPQSRAFRIGLCWRSAGAGNAFWVSQLKLKRSLPLRVLQPLAGLPGVELVSLQIGEGSEELGSMPRGMRVTDLTPCIDDFADTAALIERLDLVVCIDTVTAHVAGALGKPVFVVLPHVGDWRWLDNRADSPWYPSARLFRQQVPNDWRAPVEQAAAAARALIATRGGRGGLRRWLRL